MKLTVKQLHGLLKHTDSPYIRAVVVNLEKLKLPSKHSSSTGDTNRHSSDDTARRPPFVKASLSVSFGQCAPHRATTRDSSPIRRTSVPHEKVGEDEPWRSPSNRRSQSRERDRDRDRERDYVREREHDQEKYRQRDRDRDQERGGKRDKVLDREHDRERSYDYERRSRHGKRESRLDYERSSREDGRYYCSRSRSKSMQAGNPYMDHPSSPPKDGSKDKTFASNNLAKLKDIY